MPPLLIFPPWTRTHQGALVRVYDFPFGFCIPNSTNSWEAIYDVPAYGREQIEEYVSTYSCMPVIETTIPCSKEHVCIHEVCWVGKQTLD